MVELARPIVQHEKGAGSFGSGLHLGNDVWVFSGSGTPTDGTSGDGAGWAGPGSLYTDRTATTGKLYINTGTKASPTYTVVGAQTA